MTEDKTNTQVTMDDITKKIDSSYKEVMDRLNDEKKRLENELRQEYRTARKYVRSHPEEGVIYSFIGGVVVGVLLARIFSR